MPNKKTKRKRSRRIRQFDVIYQALRRAYKRKKNQTKQKSAS